MVWWCRWIRGTGSPLDQRRKSLQGIWWLNWQVGGEGFACNNILTGVMNWRRYLSSCLAYGLTFVSSWARVWFVGMWTVMFFLIVVSITTGWFDTQTIECSATSQANPVALSLLRSSPAQICFWELELFLLIFCLSSYQEERRFRLPLTSLAIWASNGSCSSAVPLRLFSEVYKLCCIPVISRHL